MTKKIPIIKTVLADLHTPLSVYLKLANQPYSYLLESFLGGEKWGRYSIVGLSAKEIIEVRQQEIKFYQDKQRKETIKAQDPLEWIKQYKQQYQAAPIPELPQFAGGLVGYFGYDTVRYVEPRLAHCPNPDPLDLPDIVLMLSEELAVFDNIQGKLYLIVYCDNNADSITAAQQRLTQMQQQLLQPLPTDILATTFKKDIGESDFKSNQTRRQYDEAINKIKQYIVDGDVMQVVYSQRLSVDYDNSPLNLYRALRSINPSPYLFYFNFNDFHVVGSSPEILVRKHQQTITVRPIAGTRPRGKTPQQDLALEQELLADEKELAEHLMLIDLGRNDVGRISDIGTVNLTDKMIIERYSHVMHITSNVEGQLKPGMTAIDALRATLPAGTLSGAPKIRAMEIIDELENQKRGIYGGAVGYLGWNDNLDLAIAIRTAVIKQGKLYLQAGGGIVADSQPDDEWNETMNKARAVIRAVTLAEEGLE